MKILSKVLVPSVVVIAISHCSPPALTGVSVTDKYGGGARREFKEESIPELSKAETDSFQKKMTEPHASREAGRVTHVETGKSSWYSVKTNGGTKTASGIPFSDYKYTVAHRTLPFGTLVRVTNLNNGKSVEGRVTDRGPFIKGRIVDLSLVMAKQIDAYHVGIAPCKLEVLAK